MAEEWLFCYGTLLSPQIWKEQTGLEPQEPIKAVLPYWRRFQVPGAEYPAIVPDPETQVVGGLRRVAASAWVRLDAYEGSEYLRRKVLVLELELEKEVVAWTYVWKAEAERDTPPPSNTRRQP